MTMGRRGGWGGRGGCEDGGVGEVDRDDDDDEEEGVEGEGEGGDAMDWEEGATRSIMLAILSSSSGQMSGQWEKPK